MRARPRRTHPHATSEARQKWARSIREAREHLALRVRGLRSALDLTQQELAERAGLDVRMVARLEGAEDVNPTLATLVGIASGLGVELARLLRAR